MEIQQQLRHSDSMHTGIEGRHATNRKLCLVDDNNFLIDNMNISPQKRANANFLHSADTDVDSTANITKCCKLSLYVV